MRNLPKYENWIKLNEGGFASRKTQDTPLTPQIMKAADEAIKRLSIEFNSHLKEVGLPSLDFLRAVGSGSWWEDDLTSNPDKLYGDIDYMCAYPTLKLTAGNDRADEIATVKLYNEELLMFLKAEKFDWIDLEDTIAASQPTSVKVIFIIDVPGENRKGWVQADLVVTHKEFQDWAVFRFTPVRNIKGFVMGQLYSAFGNLLDISIQNRGVRAKFKGDVMVRLALRKDTSERVISLNANTFMHDIARFFWEQSPNSGDFRPSDLLKNWKGVDPKSPTLESLCDGILAVIDTLEQLGEFGTTIKWKSKQDFIKAFVDDFVRRMDDRTKSAKLEKAETPTAKAAVEVIKRNALDSAAIVKKHLLGK